MWYNEARKEWLDRLHNDLASDEEIIEGRRQLAREIEKLDRRLEEAKRNFEEQATEKSEASFRGIECDLICAYEETCIVDMQLADKGWLVCDELAREIAGWNGKLFE